MFEKLKLKRKIKLLNKRIDNENSDDARYELAMIYLDGTIIKKDEKQAIQLLQTASRNGHPKAKAYLFSNKALTALNQGLDAINMIIKTIKE